MNHQEAVTFVKEILEALRLMVAARANETPVYAISSSAIEIDVWCTNGGATVLRIVARIDPSHSFAWVVHGIRRLPMPDNFAEFVLPQDTWRQALFEYLQ